MQLFGANITVNYERQATFISILLKGGVRGGAEYSQLHPGKSETAISIPSKTDPGTFHKTSHLIPVPEDSFLSAVGEKCLHSSTSSISTSLKAEMSDVMRLSLAKSDGNPCFRSAQE